MYVSSIIELSIPVEDLHNRYINTNRYIGKITVYPSTRYDIWGTEDPRVYELDGKLYMTYVGRSINYFNPVMRKNRTLPVTAVYDEKREEWVKRYVFTVSPGKFGEVVSNKDAFLYSLDDNSLFLFHRPHLSDESFRLMISYLGDKNILSGEDGIKEIEIKDGIEIMKPANFECRLGWASPLLGKKDRLIVLIHSVDKHSVAYRVFAAELKLSRSEIAVEAVTPHYIMEPSTPYEIIGDRPLVVFPCGAARIGGDKIVVTYGAADYMIGVGVISIDRLAAELDSGRIY